MTIEALASYATIAGIVGTAAASVGAWVLHQKDAAQELKMEAQGKEITRASDGIHAAFAQIDRLKDERQLYLTKSEGDKLRSEIKADIKEMGDRLVGEIDRLLRRP